ncbi:hypothetical protein EYW47_33655 [Paraburkholderia silviterrae]|uniref:Uncharacterized protein n=1 Tax=Paraburkholderia silviterrae TaxID=2528715 RepID=A0A4R5M0M8_9BURK|nr:hypothetical protein EYW47_33655 [Paraburkholderia silviterrae]
MALATRRSLGSCLLPPASCLLPPASCLLLPASALQPPLAPVAKANLAAIPSREIPRFPCLTPPITACAARQ